MKRLFCIFIAACTICSSLHAQWYQVYSQSIAQSCFAIKFYNTSTGYHSGVLYNSSTFNIYKTTNGGVNWTSQNSGYTAQRFMAIHIIHPDTVFICGNYGKILRTYNGGVNWNTVYSDTNVQLWAMKFVNSNTGFTAGSFGTILKTTNKGDNWFPLQSGMNNAFEGMYFLNETTGYICGSLVVLKTTNAGNSFTNLNAPFVSGEINTDIYFANEMSGWFSTNSGRIVKTTNGGINWNIVLQDIAVWRLAFTNPLTGYGCRSDGKVVKTTNGGDNWYIQNSPLTENLYDIHFPSPDTGYICSWSGKILKTTNGGGNMVPVSNIVHEGINGFQLHDNSPNPFNSETIISFEIPVSANINLILYNTLGKEIRRIVNNEFKSAGVYEIDLDAADLPGGVYFCRLEAAGFVQTKRMMLLK